MKNGIKGKLGAKLVAMFLFVISAVVLVASAIALIYLFEEDAFFDDGEQLVESVRESSLNNKMSDITFDINIGCHSENLLSCRKTRAARL